MLGLFNIGIWQVVLILVIALIVFGPGKLPEVGKAIGKGIREFKGAANAITDNTEDESEKQKKEIADREFAKMEAASKEAADKETEEKSS